MRPKNEETVCEFVRTTLSSDIGEEITVEARPDREERSTKAVEQLWSCLSYRFAIEHTLLESFVGQLHDDAKFVRLLGPVETALAGQVPGTYVLQMDVGSASMLKVCYERAAAAIAMKVLAVGPSLGVGKMEILQIDGVPCPIYLGRRSATGSKVVVARRVSDVETSRLERVKRALDAKCPKLAAACRDGRISILALESNDIALANIFLVSEAVRQALAVRQARPDIVYVVETDAGGFHAWVIHNTSQVSLRTRREEADG